MTAFPWWVWVILAGILGLAEMHVPGSYLMWIALGAALTSLVAVVFDLPLSEQIGSFAVASALSCAVGFFVYRRLYRPVRGASALNERGQAMVGARGTVCEAFFNGRGKVEISRFKGLGEMPARFLRATTMDPAQRTLLRVMLPPRADPAAIETPDEGFARTANLVETLMGRRPELRFDYIQKNARFARDLDL